MGVLSFSSVEVDGVRVDTNAMVAVCDPYTFIWCVGLLNRRSWCGALSLSLSLSYS